MGFPFIVPGEGTVVGELMYINPSLYERVLKDLDHLEGASEKNPKLRMYNRLEVEAETENGDVVKCWAYFWNRPVSKFDLPIPSGDWVEFSERYKKEILEHKKSLFERFMGW
jgi:gamma-glutamylcyclotransferase (GGCT)/AIG2-like uncharacterized protein YtfP